MSMIRKGGEVMPNQKMKVEAQGGINWTWFKVQNGNLVAVFKLHHGEDPIEAFSRLMKKDMVKVTNIRVPFATWREPCNVIADHTGKKPGYRLPEVSEAFSWLGEMFKGTARDFEHQACKGDLMRHLEYHGVAVCRI